MRMPSDLFLAVDRSSLNCKTKQKRKSVNYFCFVGTFQLMGTVFYMGVEATEGFKHMALSVSTQYDCHFVTINLQMENVLFE